MLARSKLNSIEKKALINNALINKTLTNNEISDKDFFTIIEEEEEKKYRKLKGSIRMMHNQWSIAEKNKLIEGGKKIGITEGINHNKIFDK